VTLRVVTDAPLHELVDLWAAAGATKPLEIRAAMLQAARSESLCFYAGERLIAAALFYPVPPAAAGDDPRELAFACLPEAARHLPTLIHTARLTLTRFAQIDGLRLLARVRVGHEPGRRLTRLIGFIHTDTAGGFERWEWSHVEIRPRGEELVHRRAGRR
jgi:hypothetical protein